MSFDLIVVLKQYFQDDCVLQRYWTTINVDVESLFLKREEQTSFKLLILAVIKFQ